MSHYKTARTLGFVLRKFNTSDTRRIGPFQNYSYYIAKDGMLKHRFSDYESAGLWLENCANQAYRRQIGLS